jgi:hypothetical protein
MKKIFSILIIFIILVTSACKKENKSVTLIRDCTGTYLRFNDKDYKVCNLEKVEMIADDEIVTATFIKINKCNGSANGIPVCKLLHANEGWIEIVKIK